MRTVSVVCVFCVGFCAIVLLVWAPMRATTLYALESGYAESKLQHALEVTRGQRSLRQGGVAEGPALEGVRDLLLLDQLQLTPLQVHDLERTRPTRMVA